MKHRVLSIAATGLSVLLLAGVATNPARAQNQTEPAAPPAAAPIMGTPPHTLGSNAPAQPVPAQISRPQTAAVPAGPGQPLTDQSQIGRPTGQRETAALNLLEAHGYGNFTEFHADGANYTATVNNPDGSYAVLINPDSGQVIRR